MRLHHRAKVFRFDVDELSRLDVGERQIVGASAPLPLLRRFRRDDVIAREGGE